MNLKAIKKRALEGQKTSTLVTPNADVLALVDEVERLKVALRHAMVCTYPEPLQFRCKGCVEAEKALKGRK